MSSRVGMSETVKPIKSRVDRNSFKDYWFNHSPKLAPRNWVLFKLGIITALRASDLVRLSYSQVYKSNGNPRTHIINQKDKKTGKENHYLDIEPLRSLLVKYNRYLHKLLDNPKWLFPRSTNLKEHITSHYMYILLKRTSKRLGIANVGSHSLRKTCGYIAYKQTHNILYVMKRLNQSNPKVTLRYIDMDRASIDKITNSINWN